MITLIVFFHLYSLLINKVISVCCTSNYTVCCNELFPNSPEIQFVFLGNYPKSMWILSGFCSEKHKGAEWQKYSQGKLKIICLVTWSSILRENLLLFSVSCQKPMGITGYYNFRVQFLISFSPVPQSKCTCGFFEAVSVHILLSLSDGINLLDTQQGWDSLSRS